MEEEIARPVPTRLMVAAPVLDNHSVADLRAYIEDLRAESGRAEAQIARRGSARAAADAVFRRPG